MLLTELKYFKKVEQGCNLVKNQVVIAKKHGNGDRVIKQKIIKI